MFVICQKEQDFDLLYQVTQILLLPFIQAMVINIEEELDELLMY